MNTDDDKEKSRPQSEPLKDGGDPIEKRDPQEEPEEPDSVEKLVEDGRARGF